MTTQTIEVGTIAPELLEQASTLVTLAATYEITSPEMREAGSADLKRIKALYKAVDEQEKEITRPINKGLQAVRDMFRKPKGWLEQAEAILTTECRRWDAAEDRKRREAEAAAALAADEERKRLVSIAAAETQSGNTETAVAILEAAALVAPVPVPAAPKHAGESPREIWSAEVVDLVAMCKAIGEGTIPPHAVEPNMTFWNAQARSYKNAFKFPGVLAKSKIILASRTAQ